MENKLEASVWPIFYPKQLAGVLQNMKRILINFNKWVGKFNELMFVFLQFSINYFLLTKRKISRNPLQYAEFT